MDYSKLLTKAWTTIWNNKFLIGLGIVIEVFSGGGGGGNSQNFGGNGGGDGGRSGQPGQGPSGVPGFSGADMERFLREAAPMIATVTAIIGVVICVAVVIGLVVFALTRIIEGGQISGIYAVETGQPTGFGMALSAGWKRGWALVGIGLLTGIPGLIIVLVIIGLVIAFFTSGNAQLLMQAAQANNPRLLNQALAANQALAFVAVALCCPLIVLSWATTVLRVFADRACMIEGTGVMASVQRGWQVLRDNLGQAVLLILIQLGIGLALGLVLAVPSFILALCFVPFLWVINGTQQSYFATLWTLAWREWTGPALPAGEPAAPTPAPAV